MASACQTDAGLDKIQASLENTVHTTTKSISSDLTKSLDSLNPFTKREKFCCLSKIGTLLRQMLLVKEKDYFQDYFEKMTINHS